MQLLQALALSVMLTNPGLNNTQAEIYSRWVLEFSNKNDLDPWLVEALISKESRWKATAVRRETNGSCSVGLGQINLTVCDPVKVTALQDPLYNIRRTAKHLALAREICPKIKAEKKCSQGKWIGLYNPGNRTYASDVLHLMEEHRARYDIDDGH